MSGFADSINRSQQHIDDIASSLGDFFKNQQEKKDAEVYRNALKERSGNVEYTSGDIQGGKQAETDFFGKPLAKSSTIQPQQKPITGSENISRRTALERLPVNDPEAISTPVGQKLFEQDIKTEQALKSLEPDAIEELQRKKLEAETEKIKGSTDALKNKALHPFEYIALAIQEEQRGNIERGKELRQLAEAQYEGEAKGAGLKTAKQEQAKVENSASSSSVTYRGAKSTFDKMSPEQRAAQGVSSADEYAAKIINDAKKKSTRGTILGEDGKPLLDKKDGLTYSYTAQFDSDGKEIPNTRISHKEDDQTYRQPWQITALNMSATSGEKNLAEEVRNKRMLLSDISPMGGARNRVSEYLATMYPGEYSSIESRNTAEVKKQFTSATPTSPGGNLIAYGTAIRHFGDLGRAAEALNNKNIGVLNKLANNYGVEVKGLPERDVFNAIRDAAVRETMRSLTGSSVFAQQAVEELQSTLSNTRPEDLTKSVIAGYIRLMRGRAGELQNKYYQETGESLPTDKAFSKEAQSVLKEYGFNIGEDGSATTQSKSQSTPKKTATAKPKNWWDKK